MVAFADLAANVVGWTVVGAFVGSVLWCLSGRWDG